MTVTVAIVLTCAFCLMALLFYVRRGAAEIHSPSQLSALAKPIDLQSFNNLIERSELEYLRERLSRRDFLRLERKRSLVLADYVWRIWHNAALLIGFAHYLNEEQQEFRSLMTLAVKVRVYSAWVIALLYLKYLVPSMTIPVPKLMTSYEAAQRALPQGIRLSY